MRDNKRHDNIGIKRQEDRSINRPDYPDMYLVYCILFSIRS